MTSEREVRRRVAAVVTVAVVVGGSAAACGGEGGGEGGGDSRIGAADLADCHDTGPDAEGSVFAAHPQRDPVWSFDGHPTDQVVAVRWSPGVVELFVADGVSGPVRDRVLRELGRDAR